MDINQDYIALSNLSQANKLSDEFVFKKIAEFDKKYKNDLSHFNLFEGLLSNIGVDQKSIKILNCVIKRLKSKEEKLSNKNKYHYDLANTICAIADIQFEHNNDISYLLNIINSYRKAKKEFMQVKKDGSTYFEPASTNIANILEKHGRNYEALFAYDRALKYNPNFGMALGNKAIALGYYISLAPKLPLPLLNLCYLLLKKALNDSRITELGGILAVEDFKKILLKIENYFSDIKYTPKETLKPSTLTNYQEFILTNNLYLNYDFGFYYDDESLRDNFFPNLIEEICSERYIKSPVMSKKIYFTFQVFNQIMEDFITSRYNFYNAINSNFDELDEKTYYISTLDYTRHCLKYGLLKSIFSTLYNCLDKIAHLVKYYFSSGKIDENENIYFDWLTTEKFREIIKEDQNYQLVALFSLALDFKTNGQYYILNQIRNRIIHSFLNVNIGIGYNLEYQHFEVTEEDLIEHLYTLLLIVKSAILYIIIAIKQSHNVANTLPMPITFQNDIYKLS